MKSFLQFTRSVATWFISFIVVVVVCSIGMGNDDSFAGVVMAFAFLISTILSSKFSPIRDMFGEKWKIFLTILRYMLDCIGFISLYLALFEMVSIDRLSGISGLILLFLVLLSAYILNAHRINLAFKYLSSVPSKRRPSAPVNTEKESVHNVQVATPHKVNSDTKDCEIFVFRKRQLQSYGKSYIVILDGVPSGRLRSGKSVLIKAPSGQHRLDFKGYAKIEASVDFTIPPLQKRTNVFTSVNLINGKIVVNAVEASQVNFSEVKESPQTSNTSAKPARPSITMAHIDKMEGHDFEAFTADLLRKLGYENVRITRGSGDQGVDVLAVKNGKTYGIQCKRYNQKLGNKPVQEVYAGKTIYGCSVAVVLTNNYFTEGAKEAARATGVELWDRDTLQRMLVYAEEKEKYLMQTM